MFSYRRAKLEGETVEIIVREACVQILGIGEELEPSRWIPGPWGEAGVDIN